MRHRVILLLVAMVVSAASFASERADGLTDEQVALLRKIELRRTMRGYKAFYEAGYEFCESSYKGSWGHLEPFSSKCDKFSFATSHGFQFNNFFYLGAGIGLDYYTRPELKKVSIPLFVDARVNFLNKRFSPFFDCRFGYSAGGIRSTLHNYQLGLRIGLPENHAVYVAGEFFILWDARVNQFESAIVDTLGFKLGYEF